jgi:SAM-dependent methyltransferase
MKKTFTVINNSKANFDEIYAMEDPRGYFSALGSLDYMIPDLAAPVVRQILAARARRYGKKPLVLDVGCSYGINAAVHRFPVSFATLRRRYTRHELAALSPAELLELDRNYYASWPDVGIGRFVGLDASRSAVHYARDVGLIEHGIAADLEKEALSPADMRALEDVDVILSTGSVGYVTEKTFQAVLTGRRRAPWIVSFVLRMFPYDSFSATFAEHGLVTERLANTLFVQRRFRDLAEFTSGLDLLAQRGVNTEGFESDGLLRAELYVSRPLSDTRDLPLDDVVTVCSGVNRPVGSRYVRHGHNECEVALEL